MRFVMIVIGAALIERFEWILLVFGAFLVFTGFRMWLSTRSEEEPDPANNPIVRFARRRLPFTDRLDGQRFFTRVDGKRVATPLLLALIVVEVSDLVFAVDSIPAVFAVTTDPFIVYTSNAFAILGLRSLYFFLADLKDRFRYLTHGLSIVLVFVGLKLLASPWIHLPPWTSLVVIAGVLGGAVVFSLAHARREERAARPRSRPKSRPRPRPRPKPRPTLPHHGGARGRQRGAGGLNGRHVARRHVVLVGQMGSGTSTVGRLVAERLPRGRRPRPAYGDDPGHCSRRRPDRRLPLRGLRPASSSDAGIRPRGRLAARTRRAATRRRARSAR